MILSIETSAEPASLSLFFEKEMITRTFPNKNQVNVPLAVELKALLQDLPAPLSLILVGAGPGSYSGARVGLATAEAIGITHDCPVVTLPSFYGIKHKGDQPMALIGDARRGAFFIIEEVIEDGRANVALKVLEKEAFLGALHEIEPTHALFTFEPVEKLPISEESSTKVTVVSSSSESLIHYWSALPPSQQEHHLASPKEVLYLRPPNITKAKNPFA